MRFSKQSVKQEIESLLKYLQQEYGFNSHNGWQQVNGKGEAINREYGAYQQLQTLYCSLFGFTYTT